MTALPYLANLALRESAAAQARYRRLPPAARRTRSTVRRGRRPALEG